MITRFIYPLFLREKISFRLRKFFTAINDKDVSLEFNRNIKLDLVGHDVGHKAIIFNGFYELTLSKAIAKLGAKGGILVDVGANYGYFSCLWAAQNLLNRVYAFEASPLNELPLKNNVGKNSFNDKITIIPIALGRETGKHFFNLKNEKSQTGWGGLKLYDDDDENLVVVEVDTLDNWCSNQGIQKIDVLKIDTEGADTWVLYGAQKLLEEKRIKHIFYEHNIIRMGLLKIKENEAQDYLKNLGYVVEKYSPNNFYAYAR